ncbi:MAG: hypothetical protein HZR80_06805 [Candidatus Heimdallarchaeota archaeon]
MLEEDTNLRDSQAFKEYAHGRSKKIPLPWVTIIISGVLVSVAMIATNFLAVALYGNAYAFNFILALYGIPAGFACAWKNKTFSALISLKFSTISALIATVTFFLISLIFVLTNANETFGYIVGIVELLIACAIIAVFFICVTFAMGALLGTFIAGIKDARK